MGREIVNSRGAEKKKNQENKGIYSQHLKGGKIGELPDRD